MSQHDYALADQAGLAFLADINAVLAAIVSNNSGTAEPADTYPYMLWADTTSGWIKQRNAGDTAWEMRMPLAAARADVASAATLDLDAAPAKWLRITGTTTVTAVTLADGQIRHAVANGAFTLTNGASLILPGAASYSTAAGDIMHFYGESAGVVRVEIVPVSGQAVVAGSGVNVNDFRLTLSSGVPVSAADITSATIYCTPYKGNQISLYNGSQWVTRTSAQFSKALGTLTSGKPYDVFCYDNAGTPTLEFLVWTNDTARATALAYQDGVLVKSGDATRRYLGSFYTINTTQTTDTEAKRYLYNYYHRVARSMEALESTASWTYSIATWRQANAATTNQLNFLIGVAEDSVSASILAIVGNTASGVNVGVGIGLDSTTAFSKSVAVVPTLTAGNVESRTASITIQPSAGRHYLTWLEYSSASPTTTWVGVTATRQSGIVGEVMA